MSIAVITPAYNAALTLDATLASVAAQTMLPDEVVVADDGSTDDTLAVLARWSARLPLRVVSTGGRRGPAAARAAAIAASSSRLLALLDADDCMLTDHLALLRVAYDATDDGLASADTLRWIPGRTVSETPLNALAPVPPRDGQLHWLLRGNHLSIASLFSRSRYDAVGGFRAEFHGTEDWDLWIRMVRAGARGGATALADAAVPPVRGQRVVRGPTRGRQAAGPRSGRTRRRRGRPAGDRRAARIRLEAAASLQAAYRFGTGWAARRAGLGALRGERRVAVRGAAMAVAPRTVARRRDAVRFRSGAWMRRYAP